MDSVFIRGTVGSAVVELTEREGLKSAEGSEYYRVNFLTDGINVSASVYAYDPKNEVLPRFFDELSASLGSSKVRHWASLEGEFELDCTTDSLGHVDVEAALHSNTYGPGWTVTLRFTMEASQVERAAKDLRHFCYAVANSSTAVN
jgi:hypothetical protein